MKELEQHFAVIFLNVFIYLYSCSVKQVTYVGLTYIYKNQSHKARGLIVTRFYTQGCE